MKEMHDNAKNRIVLAAAANNMVTRLGQHIGQSATEAKRKQTSPAEAAAFRARVTELIAEERKSQHASFSANITPGWKMPKPISQPWVWDQSESKPQQNQTDSRTQTASTPSSSSSGQTAPTYVAGNITLTANSGIPPHGTW